MPGLQRQNSLYKIQIQRGNNQCLIRAVFRQRWWWQVLEESRRENKVNLLWSQYRNGKWMDRLHKNNSEKQRMVSTEMAGLSQIRVAYKSDLLFQQSKALLSQKQQKYLEDTEPPPKQTCAMKQNLDIMMHNHVEANHHLSNKKSLFQNLFRHLTDLRQDPFSIMPLTFLITHPGLALESDP